MGKYKVKKVKMLKGTKGDKSKERMGLRRTAKVLLLLFYTWGGRLAVNSKIVKNVK